MKYYKKDYRPDGDYKIIADFRRDNPEEVEKKRSEIKEKYPQASEKTIERYVDNEILDPIMEEPDDNINGGSIVYLSELHDLETLNCVHVTKRNISRCKFDEVVVEHLHESLEVLGDPEKDIIMMYFGFDPYIKKFSQREIAEKHGIEERTLSRKIQDIYDFLREHIIEIKHRNKHLKENNEKL